MTSSPRRTVRLAHTSHLTAQHRKTRSLRSLVFRGSQTGLLTTDGLPSVVRRALCSEIEDFWHCRAKLFRTTSLRSAGYRRGEAATRLANLRFAHHRVAPCGRAPSLRSRGHRKTRSLRSLALRGSLHFVQRTTAARTATARPPSGWRRRRYRFGRLSSHAESRSNRRVRLHTCTYIRVRLRTLPLTATRLPSPSLDVPIPTRRIYSTPTLGRGPNPRP